MMSNLADKMKVFFNNSEMTMSKMALEAGLNPFDVMSDDMGDTKMIMDLFGIYRDAKDIYTEQAAVVDHIVEQVVETNDRLVELQGEVSKLRNLLEETNRMVKKLETKA